MGEKTQEYYRFVENYQIFCLSKSRVCTVFRTRVIHQNVPQIYRALYGNAMLVPMQLGNNMGAGNQRRHLEFTSAIKGSYITLMNK